MPAPCLDQNYPRLSQYLSDVARPSMRGFPRGLVIGTVAVIPGIPFIATLVGFSIGSHSPFLGFALFLTAFFGLVLGSFAVLGPLWFRAIRQRRMKSCEDAGQELYRLGQQGQLHHCLDPRAGDMLERGAGAWLRIKLVADRLKPSNPSADLAEEAKSVADVAMEELLHLCGRRIGPPRKSKHEELRAIHQSLRDLEFADGISAFRKWTKSTWRQSAYHDPHTQYVLTTASEIIERLEQTATELESVALDSAWNHLRTSQTATEKMDELLENLRAHRRAEAELENEDVFHSD